jgi:hypothetical protein
MQRLMKIILAIGFVMLTGVFPALAVDTQLLKAKTTNIEGRPLEGAKLFLYDSKNVRRPADFITSLSDQAGRMQIALPPGKYWVVARYKVDGKYGPLLPGDKHSGEPLEVDLTTGGQEVEFVVSDIRELGQKKRASATDALRLKGRVIDAQGLPVGRTFVYANIINEFAELPDYISAWTSEDGRYELFLPPADRYFVGASRQFPLNSRDGILKPVVLESGKIDIAMDINLTVQ